jgi:hypothetical protein
MPNEPTNPSQPPRPRRPLRYVLTILLVVLLSPIAGWFVWSRIEAARLDVALDALEARKEPLDIAEFDVKPTTNEQREASHLYGQAAKLVGNDIRAHLTGIAKTIEDLCAGPAAAQSRTEQVAALQAFEDLYKPALSLLDRGSQLDAAGWDDADRPKRNSMEEMQPANLATVNAVRIARLACTGNGDAAAALLATLRLSRVRAAGFYSRLPAQTAHSLQSLLTFTSPNPALLQKIQQEYEAVTDEHAVEKQIVYSRAHWLHFVIPGVFGEMPAEFAGQRMTPLEGIARRVTRPLRDRGSLAELREFNETVEAARQPWPAILDAAETLRRKYPNLSSQSRRPGLLEALTHPFGLHTGPVGLSRAVSRAAETLASTRASVGAIAIARYRQTHQGAVPASLQDLIPEYLSAPLIDPYSGKELKYVHDGTRYKVYSVGINREDDGGTWDQHSDLQLSRRGNPPDVGISVGAWPAAGRS